MPRKKRKTKEEPYQPIKDAFCRHYHDDVDRWMLFVDGENLTIRAQELARENGISLIEDDYYWKDTFIWPALMFPVEVILNGKVKKPPVRCYYYTSVIGDEDRVKKVKWMLWKIGFNPEVFKKAKGRKSKGVDISLTRDVLCHAFSDNYDLTVLVAGDADYIPLIDEIKRMGKLVYVVFLSNARVDSKLIMAADMYEQMTFERFHFSDVHNCDKK